MNDDVMKGKWKQARGSVKEEWGKLTDDDVDEMDGRKDRLVGKLQERYGLAKDEAERQVNDFERKL